LHWTVKPIKGAWDRATKVALGPASSPLLFVGESS